MDIPVIKNGDIIKIGNHLGAPKAQVVRIYTDDEKKTTLCGDIEIVYFQNKLKGVKDDVVWNGENWQFKNEGTSGISVNIDHYDPRLKI